MDVVTSGHQRHLPPSIYERSSFFYAELPTVSATSSPVGSLEEQEEDQESPFEDVESSSPKQKAASLLRRMRRCSSADQHQQEKTVEDLDTRMPEHDDEEEPISSVARDDQDDV